MTKKVASPLAQDVTLEVAPLPVTESEIAALPVLDAEVEPEAKVPSEEPDKDQQELKILQLKIAQLEDKFAKLQTELNTHVDKKKLKKLNKGKFNKDKKVKCKCKDKKVDIANCKCESKKLDKLDNINRLDKLDKEDKDK